MTDTIQRTTDPAESRPEPTPSNDSGLGNLVGMLLLVGATHLVSQFILDGGIAMLLVSSVALGWLVYEHLIEWRLFARRAIADAGLNEAGAAHRWLSQGTFTRLLVFVVAVVLSGSFLLHANQMDLYIWSFIYLDAFIMLGLLHLSRKQVAAQSKSKSSGIIGRKYVFWLNLPVLTLLICSAAFFMPVADLSGFSVVESFTMAWNPIWQQTANPVLAIWAGVIAGLDAAGWNIMQQISQWDISTPVKFAGWVLFFALFQALYLWLIQSAMLGTLAVAEQAKSWPDRLLGKSKAAKWGWGTFYLLIVIWLGLSLAVDSQSQGQKSFPLHISQAPAPEKVVIDPCKDSAVADSATVAATMDQQLVQEKSRYADDMDRTIDANVNQAFGAALTGVDSYLDWYFTLSGEWQRLATVVTGDVGALMQEKMQQLVMDDSGFSAAITSAQTGISNHAAEQLTASTQRLIAVVRQQVDVHPCSMDQRIDLALPSLSHDMKRIALSASATAAAATAIAMSTSAALATKLAASASAKLAAKVLAKTAAKAAAKTAGGMAGAATGGVLGTVCGPFAWVCSPTLAIAGFFGIDALFMEGDELINRDDMRKEMVALLLVQREQIKTQQKASYHKAGDTFFTRASKKAHALFTPVRDGV